MTREIYREELIKFGSWLDLEIRGRIGDFFKLGDWKEMILLNEMGNIEVWICLWKKDDEFDFKYVKFEVFLEYLGRNSLLYLD